MRKRKICALGIAIMLACMLPACTRITQAPSAPPSSTPVSSETPSSSEPPDITIAGVVFQEDQFMLELIRGYEDAAKDAGAACIVKNTDWD